MEHLTTIVDNNTYFQMLNTYNNIICIIQFIKHRYHFLAKYNIHVQYSHTFE